DVRLGHAAGRPDRERDLDAAAGLGVALEELLVAALDALEVARLDRPVDRVGIERAVADGLDLAEADAGDPLLLLGADRAALAGAADPAGRAVLLRGEGAGAAVAVAAGAAAAERLDVLAAGVGDALV